VKIETQAEADYINKEGMTAPYRAANGHLMKAPVDFPKVGDDERDYRVGDEVKYQSWAAECDISCRHDVPPEDW